MASLCLVASRSTVATNWVELVVMIAVALPPPLLPLFPLLPELPELPLPPELPLLPELAELPELPELPEFPELPDPDGEPEPECPGEPELPCSEFSCAVSARSSAIRAASVSALVDGLHDFLSDFDFDLDFDFGLHGLLGVVEDGVVLEPGLPVPEPLVPGLLDLVRLTNSGCVPPAGGSYEAAEPEPSDPTVAETFETS